MPLAALFSFACAPASAQYTGIRPASLPPVADDTRTSPYAKEPGLLFYLSGDHSLRADYAANGRPDPNFQSDVQVLPGGAHGSYIQCGNNQLLSYWAAGNVYAQRGTLSFYWRSRDPVDETAFPVFRVGYADHTSWDQTWLRIDYNGHGFDAFVTDINLGRTRVSVNLSDFPKPDQWTHLALTWDETTGIRFYINGKLAAEKAATGMFDAALDQFGPHSRIIGPTGVESSYNFDRGGDIDEVRFYDRALSDANIAELANGQVPTNVPSLKRDLAAAPPAAESPSAASSSTPLHAESWLQEWWFRYGWNRPGDPPAALDGQYTTVRKVQVNEAYDLKRWYWRGLDGIRETTWPGVYNRSKLTGRWDYFQLPDSDCYSTCGKSITLYMPREPWNDIEIDGGAWGNVSVLTPGNGDPRAVADPDQHDPSPQLATTLFERPQGQERTSNLLAKPITGERIRFTNVVQEWPIGELSVYYVHPGREPANAFKLAYRLSGTSPDDNPSLDSLVAWIDGRYPVDERQMLVAAGQGGFGRRGAGAAPGGDGGDAEAGTEAAGGAEAGARQAARPARGGGQGAGGRRGRGGAAGGFGGSATRIQQSGLPIVHILIPVDMRGNRSAGRGAGGTSWQNIDGGLDGIAIDLPALNLKPTHGDLIPMNVRIKDPLWPMRDMLDFNFSVKPGEPHTLWLDTRDRILPNNKSLYITIASASPEFGAASLEGAELRLVFKPRAEALPEHIADRLTQVKDNYANMVEEAVSSEKLNTWNRFYADITDLLRVDPTNDLGRKYWWDANKGQPRPQYTQPVVPEGVPAWAWLQVRDMDYFKWFVNWYIDNRQIANGEFGGGLPDDSDLTDIFPGVVFMGAPAKKITDSVSKELEATFSEGLWINGLAAGQYDELHSYEDGINILGQMMLLDYGSPREVERAMVTARRLEWFTGINAAGHRHIRSAYFNGAKMSEDGVWGWSKSRSYFVFQPALSLVLYNGTPETKKMMLEMADGLLAHRRLGPNGRYTINPSINFKTDQEAGPAGGGFGGGGGAPWFILWSAYRWTGDKKYLQPLLDDGAVSLQQVNADAIDFLNLRDTYGKQYAAAGGQFGWQMTGDTHDLEQVYRAQLEQEYDRKYLNTEGSMWIDRIADGGGFNTADLQRARLGGIALQRDRIYPGNVISWQFDAPATDESVAILIPEAAPDHFKVVAYNLDSTPVTAHMAGAQIDPGTWQIAQGTADSTTGPMQNAATRTVDFERSKTVDITFAPHTYTVLELKLVDKGVPYWSRPDLGLDPGDVKVEGRVMRVTVHSIGAVAAPASKVVLRDASGKVLASAKAGPLKAPLDLTPKTETVSLKLPAHADYKGGSVTIEPSGSTPEITDRNNRVQF
ncbi:MAG TPA: LamG domain-containing protein [Acidobacteriaceae bacterium]|nr:LamG domain-containing protein [Acidobacteriaceae bacterium]